MSLECPEKRNIDVVWANFGRLKGAHVCGDGFLGLFSWYQRCHNGDSLTVVRDACQDKEYCTLQASVAKFGDACWGTTKYLEVRKNSKIQVSTFAQNSGNSTNNFFLRFFGKSKD